MLFKYYFFYYFCYDSLPLSANATIIIFFFCLIDLKTWTAEVVFVSVPLLYFMIMFNFLIIITIVFLYSIYWW